MKFSLVVPLAPERDARVIESIKDLDYPKNNFHVVVVKGKNPSENRNKGIEVSRGEIIGFLDDDAIVSRDLLKQAEEFFNLHPEIDVVGGPQLTPRDEEGFAKISGYALSSLFGAWRMSNRYAGRKNILDADETMLTSANLFCRRNVVKKIKFNPDLFPGEDPEFISKIKRYGFKIAYSPDIVVYHKRRANIRELAKQIYNYGLTRPKKESFKESLKMPFFIIPSIFLIYLVLLVVFLASNFIVTGNIVGYSLVKNLNFLLLIPLLLYLIINLSFSLINSLVNKDFLALIVLPYIYFVIHLSYGYGFLKGTIENILNRRKKFK